MAETTDSSSATADAPPAASGSGRREMTLRIDESAMQSAYTNTFRTEPTLDEVILDFGMNRLVPGKQDEMVFKVRQQVILSWRNAKRLALTLANVVRQHEERYGEIEMNPVARGSKTAGAKAGKSD